MSFQPDKDFKNIFDLLGNNPQGSGLEDAITTIDISQYDLESFLRPIIVDQRNKSLLFFMKTIDRISKNTDDYRRLRNLIVDWYASHKTILENRKNSITDSNAFKFEDIIEKLKSMGFNFLSQFANREDLINLYKDIVEIYKIKGSPDALRQIFSFLNNDIKIYEFWLDYNGSNLFLNGYNVFDETDTMNLDFNSITNSDPQWFIQESDILNMLDQNEISLPLKTKYIAVSPSFSMENLKAYFLILDLKVRQEIDAYNSDPNNFSTVYQKYYLNEILSYPNKVSILELYLSYIYLLEKYYNISFNENGRDFYSYYHTDSTSTDYYDIFSDFIDRLNLEYIPGNPCESFTERVEKISCDMTAFNDIYLWKNGSFIYEKLFQNSFDDCLSIYFNDLKTALDNFLFINGDSTNGFNLDIEINILKLIKNINDLFDTFFLDSNFNVTQLPNLLDYLTNSSNTLGIDFLNIINFFKPYHTKPILESYISIKERLFNTALYYDKLMGIQTKIHHVDKLHAGEERCYLEYPIGSVIKLWDVQGGSYYDCEGLYDKGVAWDKFKIVMNFSSEGDHWTDLPASGVIIINESDSSTTLDLKALGDSAGLSNTDKITDRYIQSTGFPEYLDMDSTTTFDLNTAGFDIVEVFVRQY